MNRYTVIVTEKADEDIFNIGLYIVEELHNLSAAKRLLELVDKRILELELYPKMHSTIRNKRLREYRKIHVMNFIIFYTVDDSTRTVMVQRVLYGRRDWMHLLYLDQ